MAKSLFAKSEAIEFGLSFGIERIHEKSARGFGLIFLFAADSGVRKIDFVPKLFGGHPFCPVSNDGELLGTIAGRDNEALMKFAQVMAEVCASFLDEGVSGFVGTGVVDSEEVSNDFFVRRSVPILGIKNELGVVGVVGRESSEMVDEGAPCFFQSSPIAYLFEVVPSSDNVVAVDKEYSFGSGGRFHGLQDRLKVMALGVMIGNRPYDDTVVCMLPQIIFEVNFGVSDVGCFFGDGCICDRSAVWGCRARWGVGIYCGDDAV